MRILLPADRQLKGAKYKWSLHLFSCSCFLYCFIVVLTVHYFVLQAALQLAVKTLVAWIWAHSEAGKLRIQHILIWLFVLVASYYVCLCCVSRLWLRSRWLFCVLLFFVVSFRLLCVGLHCACRLSFPSVTHKACLTQKQRKNIFHCLINIAWKMSLFVMWPLKVIWMRLIFHPGLQSSLFSQPLSYH